jgi:competence protein ComEC
VAGAAPLALVGARFSALRTWLTIIFEREMERGRGFLWLPVLFSLGVLIYFVLPREPSRFAPVALVAALAIVAWLRRHRTVAFRIFLSAAAVAAGLCAAKIRTDLVAAPTLSRQITTTLTGWVASEEESPRGGKRLVLRVSAMAPMPGGAMPAYARLTVRNKAAALADGDAIRLKASLAPAPGPVMPGGYDFSYTLFYQRIGAVGFAFGGATPAAIGPPPLSIRLAEPLAHLRDRLRGRVEDALPGDYGHIAAALIMGDQRGIDEDTQDAMRASGLGHILSISGLHLALVAGSVFWLLRALLALSPMLALNYPIKKWAASGALVVATIYLGISGSEVATVRSYVMLAIMLGAILIDRRALTLRNVALAAIVILIFSPESLLSISFQMSFAATIAVIATYEAFARRADRVRALPTAREHGILRRVRENLTTLFVTSLAAGLATLPFAAFYFQRVAPLLSSPTWRPRRPSISWSCRWRCLRSSSCPSGWSSSR